MYLIIIIAPIVPTCIIDNFDCVQNDWIDMYLVLKRD